MSSTQSFSFLINRSNISSCYSSHDSNVTIPSSEDSSYAADFKGDTVRHIYLNDYAKGQIFPNSTAHPISLTYKSKHTSSGLGTVWHGIHVNGDSLCNFEKKGKSGGDYEGSITIAASSRSSVANMTKGSTISLHGNSKWDSGACLFRWGEFTLYFTRYDFAAVAGTGIASSTANESTGTVYGYDGDTITFKATPAAGYRFDHWSDGSTDNPHTITVNGADKTLTAYGVSTGKNLSVLHGNTLTVNETVSGNVTVGIGQTLGSLPFTLSDGAKTLNAKNKVMPNNVTVGAKTLLCKDKIASYHIPILLCSGEWKSNYALNRSSSDHTVALNGWIITPYIKIPAGCTNITIESGGTQANECLEEYDSNLGYLSYWGGGSNPRTFNFDYPGSIVYVRATFNMANLANCYIKDNTHNVYIFRGGNV